MGFVDVIETVSEHAGRIADAGTFIASEIQGVPQGFEDFRRSAGPVMKAQSLDFNAYTFALWFGGDLVQINPNGIMNVVARVNGPGPARAFVQEFAKNSANRVYLLVCPPGVKVTDYRQVSTQCRFEEFAAGSGAPVGTSPAGGSTPPAGPGASPPPAAPGPGGQTTGFFQAGLFGGQSSSLVLTIGAVLVGAWLLTRR